MYHLFYNVRRHTGGTMYKFDGKLLRKIRKERGLTQTKLAELITDLRLENDDTDERVVEQSLITDWERGKRTPNSGSLSRLVVVLKASPNDFFSEEADPTSGLSEMPRYVFLEMLYQAVIKGDKSKEAEALAGLRKLDDDIGAASR